MQNLKFTLLLIICITFFSSCSVYNVTVMNEDGDVVAEHTTRNIYSGTESFIIDLIVDPFVMIGSLFVPMPTIQASNGLNEGMNLTNYMKSFTRLVPVSGISLNSVPSVNFDADDGQEYSYMDELPNQ